MLIEGEKASDERASVVKGNSHSIVDKLQHFAALREGHGSSDPSNVRRGVAALDSRGRANGCSNPAKGGMGA